MRDPRAQYAEERADGMAHRHPMVALIYRVVADVLDHAPEQEQEEAA